MRSLKKDKTTSHDLTTPLDYTTDYTRKFRLGQIILRFGGETPALVTETVTITLDSIKGANYDTILAKRSLVNESNFVFRPQGDPDYQAGDNIRIQCTSATATCNVYATVKAREILL